MRMTESRVSGWFAVSGPLGYCVVFNTQRECKSFITLTIEGHYPFIPYACITLSPGGEHIATLTIGPDVESPPSFGMARYVASHISRHNLSSHISRPPSMIYMTHQWLYTKLTDLGVTTTALYAVRGLMCRIHHCQH